ncbi:MAG TPA: hypothetical protein VII68_14870 [Casimicrobiaceae bacterium]|jgi:hypothetical protein
MATHARVGDDAVKAKTGRTWAEWIMALDRAGAAKLPHKDIARLLNAKFGVGPWWCQMVTVGYEQAKGLRKTHQKADGWSGSASLTIAAHADDVFAAWNDARRRRAWLPDPITIRKSTAPKSLRITWHDGSNVDVNLVAKSPDRTQIGVEHSKLASAKAVADAKRYWKDALGRLGAKVTRA